MTQYMNRIIKDITVEPASFFFFTTYTILDTVNTNLFLQKACRFNTTAEPDLNTRCDDEKQGVLFVSNINSNYRFAMFTLCTVYTILATCWSDESGRRRRPIIFLPIIGQLLQGISGCLHSYFWRWAPMAAVISDISAEVLGGGVVLMAIATQIYICDVSVTESRTMRLGLLLAVRTVCFLFGSGGAGYLIRSYGFFYTYLLCSAFSTISLLLACILVKDVSVPVEGKQSSWQFFNLVRVADSFKVVFKKSLGRKRIVVATLLLIYVIMFFTTQGEKTVFYLFLRYKFGWDERQYSAYLTYKFIGVIVGTIFCSVVLSKRLKIHDGLIGAFSGLWDTIAVIGYLFASQNWHLYVVPLFDIFHGTALSVSVSFMSKYYDNNEFGRLNAVLNVFSLMIPICHPMYNIVFQKTLDTFPSAFFIISAVLNIGIFFLYCYSYFITKKIDHEENVTKISVDVNDEIAGIATFDGLRGANSS